MNSRTIVIVIAAIVGCVLLAPYMGVHLLTTRPEAAGPSKQIRETSRRANPSSRQVPSRPERATTVPGLGGSPGRDLTDIEDLLERNRGGASSGLDE